MGNLITYVRVILWKIRHWYDGARRLEIGRGGSPFFCILRVLPPISRKKCHVIQVIFVRPSNSPVHLMLSSFAFALFVRAKVFVVGRGIYVTALVLVHVPPVPLTYPTNSGLLNLPDCLIVDPDSITAADSAICFCLREGRSVHFPSESCSA